jgi:hypothetical protein
MPSTLASGVSSDFGILSIFESQLKISIKLTLQKPFNLNTDTQKGDNGVNGRDSSIAKNAKACQSHEKVL